MSIARLLSRQPQLVNGLRGAATEREFSRICRVLGASTKSVERQDQQDTGNFGSIRGSAAAKLVKLGFILRKTAAQEQESMIHPTKCSSTGRCSFGFGECQIIRHPNATPAPPAEQEDIASAEQVAAANSDVVNLASIRSMLRNPSFRGSKSDKSWIKA